MPRHKVSEEKRVQSWQSRLASGNRVYQAWDTRFKPSVLQDYYLGKQWQGQAEAEAQQKYTINLIFPTIETQLPSLLFAKPQVTVEPRPPHADDIGSQAGQRAHLIQNVLQTFIDDPRVHFQAHTSLALKDAEFRFGLVEVGYSADWIDNPNAEKPILRDDGAPMTDGEGQPVREPAKKIKPDSERVYLKRIPPQTARVSPSQRNILEENDWFAYYEWHYVEDVKANPTYRHTDKLKAGGSLASLVKPEDAGEGQDGPQDRAHMVKLWKVWDFRTRCKYVMAEGHDKFLVDAEPYAFFPIAALKFIEIPDQWYPLPPTFNWLSPQDEIN
jgi:hypothetical protein